MSIEEPGTKSAETPIAFLADDVRWLLVQRILRSSTFQRAEQLRKILSYVSQEAILHPDQTIREYEIAFNALGRRSNFDATQDNIVRVQFTHLRRKLEIYFLSEGSGEPVVITIPKGSYSPYFLPAKIEQTQQAEDSQEVLHASSETSHEAENADIRHRPKSKLVLVSTLVAIGLLGWALSGFLLLRNHSDRAEKLSGSNVNEAFLTLLAQSKGSFSVVAPDTSEMLIRFITGLEIPPDDYARHDYPEKQIASIRSSEAQYILSQLALRRTTTINEAITAFEFVNVLRQVGKPVTLRYARDLHVSNFNEGNTILLGSYHSDPWVWLFVNQMNFRLVRDVTTNTTYFENRNPLHGEESRYFVYAQNQVEQVNYGHIALVPNASKSGFVLLIEGSDMESVESGVNFLLHGQLKPQIASLLTRKDIRPFEIFLRGRHLKGESEDSLEVLSVRTKSDW